MAVIYLKSVNVEKAPNPLLSEYSTGMAWMMMLTPKMIGALVEALNGDEKHAGWNSSLRWRGLFERGLVYSDKDEGFKVNLTPDGLALLWLLNSAGRVKMSQVDLLRIVKAMKKSVQPE